MTSRMRRSLILSLATLVALTLTLATAAGASANGTITWGVSGVTPSLDTANGDYSDSQTPGVTPNSACPNGIDCSPEINTLSGTNPILPAPFSGENTANAYHSAEDLAVWSNGVTAPAGGQIDSVNLTGCAIEDTSAPTQESQGVPVNTALIQSLTPTGSDYDFDATSQQFTVPFCNNAVNNDGVTPSTVTTFVPTHMCVDEGDVVAFHDIGGFVEANGQAYYPEGVPMDVLAPTSGTSTDSFVGAGTTVYGSDVSGGSTDTSGFASEADQEVTMQIVESTGDDAYQLCSGGFANEPSTTSNTINCDWHNSGDAAKTPNPNEYPDYPFCSSTGQPIPGSNEPGSTSTPTSAGSASGSAAAGGGTTPTITRLKLNPPLFVSRRGTTVTYTDSEPGIAALRVYRVEGKRDKLIETIRHQDRSNAGLHLGGLKPGRYLLTVTSSYDGKQSLPVTTRFRVIARR